MFLSIEKSKRDKQHTSVAKVLLKFVLKCQWTRSPQVHEIDKMMRKEKNQKGKALTEVVDPQVVQCILSSCVTLSRSSRVSVD